MIEYVINKFFIKDRPATPDEIKRSSEALPERIFLVINLLLEASHVEFHSCFTKQDFLNGVDTLIKCGALPVKEKYTIELWLKSAIKEYEKNGWKVSINPSANGSDYDTYIFQKLPVK